MSSEGIELAAARFGAGAPVVIAQGRGQTSVVAVAAAHLTQAALRQMTALGGELMGLAVDDEVAERIGIRGRARSLDCTACADGGWSARDRVLTLRAAADPRTGAADFVSPGHVLVRRAEPLSPSPESAALELARVAERPGAVVLFALARAEVRMLAAVSAEDLRRHALARPLAAGAVRCELPTAFGDFEAVAFGPGRDGDVMLALAHGRPSPAAPALVHTHTACVLGDVFASTACGCRAALAGALHAIRAQGTGVVLYTKPGLADPFRCPAGAFPDVALAGALLRDAGVRRVSLGSGAAALAGALAAMGFELLEAVRAAA